MSAEQTDEPIAEEIETDVADRAEKQGERVGVGVRKALRAGISLLGGVINGLVSAGRPLIPFKQRLFQRMAIKSLENYYKTSGGDAIGIVTQPGQKLSLVPVLYKGPEEVDETERPGWHAKGVDKVWEAGSEDHEVDFLGRTPIVPLDRDDAVVAGWLKPRIGEAIELDRYNSMYNNPTIETVFDVRDPGGKGGEEALADGGTEQIRTEFAGLQVADLGEYSDEIVDLSSRDGYDGLRVSFRKATEWAHEKTTAETMQMQEDRGYLIGQMTADEGPSVIKLLLICAGIILGTLAMIFVVPQLLGGESVTEMAPLLTTPFDLLAW